MPKPSAHERQDLLEDFRQKMVAEFTILHPEAQGLTPEESLQLFKDLQKETVQANKRRMKEHLEVFSDAVIAIVITIMLLEIPIPSSTVTGHQFINSILIFLVTFFTVADFWYDNHKAYDNVDNISSNIVVIQFFFMASLALLQLFARWMMEEITTIAVLSYGAIIVLTHFLQWLLQYLISQAKFAKTNYTKQFSQKMALRSLFGMTAVNLTIMLFANFINPHVGFYFYLFGPIASFLKNITEENKRRHKHRLP
ncbi:TMEM175 family protein [Streptococcus suis]|nr:TMEM175 family protein [Streptococcus suis]